MNSHLSSSLKRTREHSVDPLFDNEEYDNENDDDDCVDEEEEEVEEEVTLSENESGMMENFISKVKRMCVFEDEIKEINRSKKAITDEKNELKKEIIAFMVAKDVGKVNYGEDEVLYVESKESAGSLNRKSLLNAIKSYYEVNDIEVSEAEAENLASGTKNRLHDAQDLYSFIDNYLGKENKIVLVREARNKKKRAKKNNSLSVFENK